MSTSNNDQDDKGKKIPRWQFRKQKKIEKRRKKRQDLAQQRLASMPQTNEPESVEPVQDTYEADKQRWLEREKQFRLIELAKKKAQEKVEEAKRLSKKRWEDTLLNLPMIPPSFSTKETPEPVVEKISKPIFKTFVPPSDAPSKRKTYREKYLEQKKKVKK